LAAVAVAEQVTPVLAAVEQLVAKLQAVMCLPTTTHVVALVTKARQPLEKITSSDTR
jgi:hypothetical protein